MRSRIPVCTGFRALSRCVLIIASNVVIACSPDAIVGQRSLPAGISDPATINTARGAAEAYLGTRALFVPAYSEFVDLSGLLSDELRAQGTVLRLGGDQVDQLMLPEGRPGEADGLYMDLARARGQAQQAQGLLATYAADSSRMRAEAYALQGYTELLLNEMFCSGVPLSTLDFNGNFTYQPGSSTHAVYQDAVSLFDKALGLTPATEQVLNLARVGKARALLGLGEYDSAAQVAALVPDGFMYAVQPTSADRWAPAIATGGGVSDREGVNGLDFVSSGDPRTATSYDGVYHHPMKYGPDGLSPIVLADWIEGRLIQAEAALQAAPNDTMASGSGWLGTLNLLRETAIVPALPDTSDPGSLRARVDLLFRERAFWLFVTGHREGDMRRLVRQYGRDESQVYPAGPYDAGSGNFGTSVNAPVPPTERQYNSRFSGCINRKA